MHKQYECGDVDKDKKSFRKLRKRLKIGKKELALSEGLKREMHQVICIRAPLRTSHN